MAFVSAETGAHNRTGLHDGDSAADEGGIGHEDLEEGRIRRVEAVKVDALDHQHSSDELALAGERVAFEGDSYCIIEGMR